MGKLAAQAGRSRDAAELIRRAIQQNPNSLEAHRDLGNVLSSLGEFEQAIAAYREAIRLRPDHADAHNSLGLSLIETKQFDDAVVSFRQAIQIQPAHSSAYNNLASTLVSLGRLQEAHACCLEAIRLNPNLVEAYGNLGNVLCDLGQEEDALPVYREAIRLKPDLAALHRNLGEALRKLGQREDSIAALRTAIRLRPDYALAFNSLGIALVESSQFDEAIASFRHAIRFQPTYSEAYGNLAAALTSIGQINEGVALFQQAIAVDPDNDKAHSNFIQTLHYHPDYDRKAIRDELKRWNQRHAKPQNKFIQPHANDRTSTRRLRIGYVSGDFCNHVAGQNLLPLLRNHDHGQVEVFCYSNLHRGDAITPRFRQCADHWRDVWRLTDAQLAEQIRSDRIDILVDLSVHSAGNRLKAFAQKAAPVQATFAGYPGSTGLDTVDYRLTDPYLDPPGSWDEFYSETSLRLPNSFWCYAPLFSDVPVNPLPAEARGFVTFGCLCNFLKVNPPMLGLWVEILQRVDRSRLMILCPEGSHREGLRKVFDNAGIANDRIELATPRVRQKYVQLFHEIDIELDTLPYNGHTTSLDSFWMGVPVVTLVGATVVGRAGLSQLTNLGLTELIALEPRKYIEISVQLAGDLPRLAELRRTLRNRMQASPLTDAVGFARGIEAAYRQMWNRWCAGGDIAGPP